MLEGPLDSRRMKSSGVLWYTSFYAKLRYGRIRRVEYWFSMCKPLSCNSSLKHYRPDARSETCSIQPLEVRPSRPDGAGRIDCDTQTVKSGTKSNATSEDIGRMIDWCLAIELDEDDRDKILRAQASVNEKFYASSLNQSLIHSK